MKTLFFFATLLVTLSSHAATVLTCRDSSGSSYQVTREGRSPQAVLQEMDGRRIMASRAGRIQAAGQLDSYFIELFDQNGRFFLVGTDLHSPGFLTGAMDAFGGSRSVSCQLPH